ncbi:hypothetical protein [Nonomuraea sp. NPDC049309]|uniref:hypothetical protein n=1 Tax=Nonomuraea sp. NPDC049309 TaxID=3364350 RepID=UPI0037245E9C
MFTTHDPVLPRRAMAGVLGLAVTVISGCGALQPPAEPPAPHASAPAQAQASAPAATPRASEPASANIDGEQPEQATGARTTPQGTRLELGRRAVVPYRQGTIGVAVTAVEKGDPADLLRRFGQQAKGITPWYIRYTVWNVDGADLSYASGPSLSLVTADGNGTGAVVTGTLPGCDRVSAPKGFSKVGASFTSCRLAGARTGLEIVGAKFADGDYRRAPIVWRR